MEALEFVSSFCRASHSHDWSQDNPLSSHVTAAGKDWFGASDILSAVRLFAAFILEGAQVSPISVEHVNAMGRDAIPYMLFFRWCFNAIRSKNNQMWVNRFNQVIVVNV